MKLGIPIGILPLVLLAAGCHQEMLKATPFGLTEHSAAHGPPEGRVNLWPLLYHHAPATSVLWPLIERTDTTWAVRPLVAFYDGNLDVAWPLIHIATGDKTCYGPPILFWSPTYFFLFPVFSRWKSAGGQGFLTLPFGWGERSPRDGGWFYSIPFVRSWRGENRVTVLPPLLSWWTQSPDRWNAALLLFVGGMTRAPDRSSEHVFPFYWRGRSERDNGITSEYLAAVPFYAGSMERQGEEVRKRLTVLPLLASAWEDGPRRSWQLAFPFYYGDKFYVSSRDGEVEARTHVLPFVLSAKHWRADGSREWNLLFPLVAWGDYAFGSKFSRVLPFYYRSEDRENEIFGLPFFLFFSGKTSDFDKRWWTVFPLAGVTRRGAEESTNWTAWALAYFAGITRSPEEDSEWFFPFFGRVHKKPPAPQNLGDDEKADAPRLAMQTWEKRFHILFYLYDSIERPDQEHQEETYSRRRVLRRVYHDETAGDRRSIDVFPFITYDREGSESLTWSWMHALLRYERRGEGKSLRLFFLPAIRWGA